MTRNAIPGFPDWYFGIFVYGKYEWSVEVFDSSHKYPSFDVNGKTREEVTQKAIETIKEIVSKRQ